MDTTLLVLPEPSSIITWDIASEAGITGYKIYRSEDDENYDLKDTIASGTPHNFKDSNIVPGITYYYKVAAYNTHGEGPSVVVSGTVPSVTPLSPDVEATGTFGTGDFAWYSFPVTTGTSYQIQLDNHYTNKTAWISAAVFKGSDWTAFFNDKILSEGASVQTITPNFTGTVFLKISERDNSPGTYGVTYSEL
jgi:hypothetical protein